MKFLTIEKEIITYKKFYIGYVEDPEDLNSWLNDGGEFQKDKTPATRFLTIRHAIQVLHYKHKILSKVKRGGFLDSYEFTIEEK